MSLPTFVDTHCHLDYIAAQTEHPDGMEAITPEAVLARAQAQGLAWLVNPTTSLDNIARVLALATAHNPVYAAVAIHPTDVACTQDHPDWEAQIREALKHPKVVAVGETGLDYYWDTSLKALQQHCFHTFLSLAVEHHKPVIVHDRDAHEDVAACIGDHPDVQGVMHCFSGDKTFARTMLDKGFYISFAGNVTFKKALDLQEAAQYVPLDRLLIETDSPFLSPMPHRGKPNEPARAFHVAECIAGLRGLSLAALCEATTQNANQLFKQSL